MICQELFAAGTTAAFIHFLLARFDASVFANYANFATMREAEMGEGRSPITDGIKLPVIKALAVQSRRIRRSTLKKNSKSPTKKEPRTVHDR